MVACALAACGGGDGARVDDAVARDAVVRFAISAYDAKDLEVARAQARGFEAAHPGVRVEVVAQAWRADVHDFFARWLALSDPAIDVYLIDDPWVPEFAYAGWIRPLDAVEPDARAQMLPAGLRGGYWRGRLYAVPYELSANGLFYRKDLLAQAGLAPPRTLPELLEQAALLERRFGLDHGLVLHASYLHNDVFPMFWASGGEVVSDRERAAIDSPPNRAALRALAGAFRDARGVPSGAQMATWADDTRFRYHDAVASFEAGKAAFMINWLRFWELGADGKPLAGKLGVMPIPGVDGGGIRGDRSRA